MRLSARTKSPNLLRLIGCHIQSKVVLGLLELVPILIPIVIVVYVVNVVDSAVMPTFEIIMSRLSGGTVEVPHVWAGGVGVAVLALYIVGLLCSISLGRAIFRFPANVLAGIPLVRGVLNATRQATNVATSQFHFSRVVFLEWPREGMVAIGFVTARINKPGTEESLAVVYIPTVPNPTTGNMAILSEDDLYETDMTVEDAVKLVFTGGIVPPDTLALARMPIEHRVHSTLNGHFERELPD